MFIDGAWTADDVVGVIEVIDPATEEVIGSVPDAGLKATHAAIAAARRAFDYGPWPRTSPRERAAVLRRFAGILDERHDLLKKLVMAESGSVGFLADIIQVRGTIDIAEWIAEAMELAVRWTEVSPPAGGADRDGRTRRGPGTGRSGGRNYSVQLPVLPQHREG